MNNVAGIYKITNIENGNTYIGSSINISRRFEQHKKALKRGNHINRHLQYAWNLYGEESFIFSILLICDRNNLVMYEQAAIDALNPEYNVAKNAGSPNLGVVESDEQKAKISQSLKNYEFTEEHKKNLSRSAIGNTHLLGYKHSEEAKKKMSEWNKKAWADRTRNGWKKSINGLIESRKGRKPFLGKSHSEETKKKTSESLKRYYENKKIQS